jgi:A/G-specific adenine glycosylase
MHEDIQSFQLALAPYRGELRRELPWRILAADDGQRFYEVLVSEIMLQQTQVKRVIDKYLSWLQRFPTIDSLARANFSDVLTEWTGLGYSRRAKYLSDIAKSITRTGLPRSVEELTQHKGIGPNTAGAMFAYYQNEPTLFIETNIRTVLFHHFFTNDDSISDKDLLPIIELLIDKQYPREWYWALMDYGTHLKTQVKNIHKSKHYKKQTRFEGSDRQLRSSLLRRLLKADSMSEDDALGYLLGKKYILDALLNEGMVCQKASRLYLPD